MTDLENIMTKSSSGEEYRLPFENCRNITSAHDQSSGRKILVGQAPASSMLGLEDNENVREYLVDAQGKQKRSPTLVHQAIRKTLENDSEDFNVLNGGMVIVAEDAEIDDKNRELVLRKPSIINGSQTQGELLRFYERYEGKPDIEPTIKFEIVVTDNAELVAEVSIARNFQNDVKPISIAGRLGQLDALEDALQTVDPMARLRKAESDLVSDGQFVDTEKVIQVTFALLPEDVLREVAAKVDPSNKVFSYSQKTRCLRLFQSLVEDGPDAAYKDFLAIAPIAWKLYERWKNHQGFKGTRIRSIEREDGKIVEVPDGVIFPIVAAHSPFLRKSMSETWTLEIPTKVYADNDMIEAAKQAYFDIADHNPQSMGKSKACYSTLLRMTSIYAKFAE
ncbi:MAG: AIPR family protein [Sphingomonadaceae bacterium]